MVKISSLPSITPYFPFFLGVVIILSDQLTKALIRATISISESITIIPSFLSIVHFTNTGAGFGILKNESNLITLISILTVIFLFVYYKRSEKEKTVNAKPNQDSPEPQSLFRRKHPHIEQYALAAIIAGACSNLIDRIMFGTVTDFIYFHFWPAFNIADSAITIGALALIISYLRK